MMISQSAPRYSTLSELGNHCVSLTQGSSQTRNLGLSNSIPLGWGHPREVRGRISASCRDALRGFNAHDGNRFLMGAPFSPTACFGFCGRDVRAPLQIGALQNPWSALP